MLVKKIITHGKGPFKFRKWAKKNCMIGIEIGWYKPSGLRDWKKTLVGIAGFSIETK